MTIMSGFAQWADETILKELGERLAQHRLRRGLTQAQLAEEAGVAKRTLERLEAGESTQFTNALRVWRVLGLLEGLNQLVPEPPASPIEALRQQRREPQRVRPPANADEDQPKKGGWTWGDEP